MYIWIEFYQNIFEHFKRYSQLLKNQVVATEMENVVTFPTGFAEINTYVRTLLHKEDLDSRRIRRINWDHIEVFLILLQLSPHIYFHVNSCT